MTNPSSAEAGSEQTHTERDDIIDLHDTQRGLFLVTTQGLTDDQARLTPTASALSIGGLIKHVTATIVGWHDFIERGADDIAEPGADDPGADPGAGWGSDSEASVEAFMAGFRLAEDETLAEVLASYERVHAHTIELVRTVDLDRAHPLPTAPWFPPGTQWTNRRVLIHLIAETAQHAGHADIIRETIDGQKTMG